MEEPPPSHPDDAAELLSRLVACPSVNPEGAASLESPFGEARLAELLASILSDWGADVRLREVAPGRPNVVARFGGAGPRSLLLEAHSDTARADDMTIPPFEPEVREGRLHGRGACDAKGAMAAMLLGIRRVLDAGGPPATVHFVSTCGEELGACGARALVREGFRADAAVVGEPTGLAVVHAHKGAVRWVVRTEGVAGHSSDPACGVNAISRMRRVLDVIEGPLADSLRRRLHPLLGEPTVSVGVIRGGTQVNVIPASCEIEVDRRTVPGETAEGAAEELKRELERELAGALAARPGRGPEKPHDIREGIDYSVRERERYPPLEEDPEGPVARLVAGAARKVLGEAPLAVAPWCSNAGVFAGAGIPSVVFGPGSAAQAHAPDEFVALDEVAAAARVYAEIVRSFA